MLAVLTAPAPQKTEAYTLYGPPQQRTALPLVARAYVAGGSLVNELLLLLRNNPEALLTEAEKLPAELRCAAAGAVATALVRLIGKVPPADQRCMLEAAVRCSTFRRHMQVTTAVTLDELRRTVPEWVQGLHPGFFGSKFAIPPAPPGGHHGRTEPDADPFLDGPEKYPPVPDCRDPEAIYSCPEYDAHAMLDGVGVMVHRKLALKLHGYDHRPGTPNLEATAAYLKAAAWQSVHYGTAGRWGGRCKVGCHGCYAADTRTVRADYSNPTALQGVTMDAKEHSILAAVFTPCIVACADVRLAGVALKEPLVEMAQRNAGAEVHVSPEWCKERFTRGDTPVRGLVQLTVTTYATVVGRALHPWENDFLRTNFGEPEFAVAGTLLALESLPRPVLAKLVGWGWHRLPLSLWGKTHKEWLTALRRCGNVDHAPGITAADWFTLRKINNVTSRVLGEADWEEDLAIRSVRMPIHLGYEEPGWMSRQAWLRSFRRHAQFFAHSTVANMVDASPVDDMRAWWEMRWAHAPGGSSSMRHAVDHIIRDDPRLRGTDRPSKKSTFEELPDHFPQVALAAPPGIYARSSVKPEPGSKLRALYASDDPAFVVSGYASLNYEKHMNVAGIKAKQTPDDVVEWYSKALLAAEFLVWLSLDYSNFNVEHEADHISILNKAFASNWAAAAVTGPPREDKVRCSNWVADSVWNKWTTAPWGHVRVYSGLFSGDRDTARDNTMLHGIYSKSAMDYCLQRQLDFELLDPNYTGDDEDSLMQSRYSALLYIDVHHACGFVLHPAKQSVGEHEFLQRLVVERNLPTRPLNASIAQFASGNWYQDKYMWYDSVVGAVSDSVWDMVCRGMPIDLGRRLAVETINASMRVPTSDEAGKRSWKKLEWWVYRHGRSEHPLWYGTEGPREEPPHIDAKPEPGTAAMKNATRSWVERQRRELLAMDGVDLSEYEESCGKSGYAALYVRERASKHEAYARAKWPERYSKISCVGAPAPPKADPGDLKLIITGAGRIGRRRTEAEVLAAMQMDEALVAALGGMKQALRHLPPARAAKFEVGVEKQSAPLSIRWYDPAIVSWYGKLPMGNLDLTRVKHMRGPGTDESGKRMRITIVRACNGAGKSTFCQNTPASVDFDALISDLGGAAVMGTDRGLAVTNKPTGLALQVAEELRRIPGAILMTQMPIKGVIDAASLASYQVVVTYSVVPATQLRARLAQRGWSTAMIDKRLRRWRVEVEAELPWIHANGWDVRLAEGMYVAHEGIPASTDDVKQAISTY